MSDADTQRAELLEGWERGARGWGRRAERVRDWGMPVSAWMIDRLSLQPGQEVLELAAGPGDTGFLAAELIAPGGKLISSDAVAAMVELARARAEQLGVRNVDFKQLQLEWIDLPTASVDAVLCRWGVMLTLDPASALREVRRVLRPGGRVALAVWTGPEENPWATIPAQALIRLGHAEAPDPAAPGPFALSQEGRLGSLLNEAGFVEPVLETVDVARAFAGVRQFVEETRDLSGRFGEAFERIGAADRAAVEAEVARLAAAYSSPDGSLRIPGRSLVAAADA